MTRSRSILSPAALATLVALALATLAPSTGVRFHRHAGDDAPHVHLEDLLAFFGHGHEGHGHGHEGHGDEPQAHLAGHGEREDSTRRVARLPHHHEGRADEAAPADAGTARPDARPDASAIALPGAADHAHLAARFLPALPSPLGAALVSARSAEPPAASLPAHPRRTASRPRARAPPSPPDPSLRTDLIHA